MSIKCAIGATAGVALIMAALFVTMLGIGWLITNYELISYVFLGLIITFFLFVFACMWKGLYTQRVAERKELGL